LIVIYFVNLFLRNRLKSLLSTQKSVKENENQLNDINRNQKIVFSLNTNNTNNEKIKLKNTLNTNMYNINNINNNSTNTKTSSHNKVCLPNNIYEKKSKITNKIKNFSLKTPLVDKKNQQPQHEPQPTSNIGTIKPTNLPTIKNDIPSPALIIEKNITDIKKNLLMEFFNKNDGFEDIYSIDSTSTADCCLINKFESRLDEGKKLLTFYNFIQKNPFLITNSLHLPIKNIDFNFFKY
jgi:hypothetical protein